MDEFEFAILAGNIKDNLNNVTIDELKGLRRRLSSVQIFTLYVILTDSVTDVATAKHRVELIKLLMV